jgi:predicted enzyme related to lactoylglutathione lyase
MVIGSCDKHSKQAYKMENKINILRIVSNIYSIDIEKSREFYIDFLDMELVMDMAWILTFASKDNTNSQISILQFDKNGKLDNSAIFISIEVSDVDALYERAKKLKYEIVYTITDEPWGVRRFFVKEPNGATINLLMH